ncbi:CBS domain-containing protein [Pseudoxanthomonas wuyuanensis]|uniref:CBS domain-containing protein n=1 Tax=Pseudoxanthomonas wuyuanensis TaxID=1073196 RepID=A0A286CYK1_9GAMM|nr:CBS domain-containing protein [Pseudoxanthomonas wuyuanensis]KAF1722754.1 CBS domain-containing protein [Pseudoxanthomonas wuyuanensis]SOD51483.1 CBS domain-containing protein [Pseudoxanthomonas wuyuanensis]
MRIADICTSNPIHIAASVRDAASLMRHRHVGALVVLGTANGDRAPVGILTDRDIVVSLVVEGVDPDTLQVSDVMTREVATCGEDQDLFDAIGTMRRNGVRRLPVLDAAGELTGMVSADDIYGAIGAHLSELGQALTREQVREMQTRI